MKWRKGVHRFRRPKTITLYYIRSFSSTYSGDVLFMISFSFNLFHSHSLALVCVRHKLCVTNFDTHTHTLSLFLSLSLISFILCLFNITWTHKRVTCHLVIFLLRNDFLLSLSLYLPTHKNERVLRIERERGRTREWERGRSNMLRVFWYQ